MEIVIQDAKTGKEYLIKGHGLDWEIFKRSKGREIDGEIRGKDEWISCRNYPSELQYAIGKVLHWFMADPNEDTKISTTTRKAVTDIRKAIQEQANRITWEIKQAMPKEECDGNTDSND